MKTFKRGVSHAARRKLKEIERKLKADAKRQQKHTTRDEKPQ